MSEHARFKRPDGSPAVKRVSDRNQGVLTPVVWSSGMGVQITSVKYFRPKALPFVVRLSKRNLQTANMETANGRRGDEVTSSHRARRAMLPTNPTALPSVATSWKRIKSGSFMNAVSLEKKAGTRCGEGSSVWTLMKQKSIVDVSVVDS